MKIHDDSICVVINRKQYRDYQIHWTDKKMKDIIDNGRNNEYITNLYNTKLKFHNETGFRILVLSETSKNNLENYTIPKDIRIDVLRSLPNRKDTIQIDKQNCIKYIKDDKSLTVIYCYRKNIFTTMKEEDATKDDMIHTFYFNIDLVTEKITTDERDTYNGSHIDYEKFIDNFYSKFLVVVTYLELTDTTMNLVESVLNKKRKQYPNVSNTSRFDVIHVNSNWNRCVININSFSVRGHWRLQPCGVGKTQYKYVYVKPFQKGLIRRLPQKELV